MVFCCYFFFTFLFNIYTYKTQISGVKEYPNEALKTVSALMALRGTYFHVIFTQTALAHFIFVTMILMFKKNDYLSNKPQTGIYALMCAFIGSFGGWTTTSWELDTKDWISSMFHYIGVIGIFSGTFALVIETNFHVLSFIPIIVSVLSMTNFIIQGGYIEYYLGSLLPGWMINLLNLNSVKKIDLNKQNKGRRKKNKRISKEQIHQSSKACILSEAVALYSAFVSLSCFLYTLQQY